MKFPAQHVDATVSYEISLYASDGASLEDRFDGTEAFELTLWAGDDRTPALQSGTAIEWIDHVNTATDPPRVKVTLARDDIDGLTPGTYYIRGVVNPTTDDRDLWAPGSTIELQAVAGTAVVPETYCTFDDMLRLSGDLLTNLQEDADQSGFVEQRHEAYLWTNQTVLNRARAILDRQLESHLPVAALDAIDIAAGVDAGPDWGPSIYPDTTVEDQMDDIAGYLEDGFLLTDTHADKAMVTANAMYALSEVYRRQIGRDESYRSKADYWHERAVKKLFSWTARLAIDAEHTLIHRIGPI